MKGDYASAPMRISGHGKQALFCWSGGKDSTLALAEMLALREYSVTALLTVVTDGRIGMHGVREELLESQASALNMPLETARIPARATDREYAEAMVAALDRHRRDGTDYVAFGDIFLEDVRAYRERNLSAAGMKALFPLWGGDTSCLAGQFIDSGFRAVVTCVDTVHLDARFAGRDYDRSFLSDLPPSVDPCGEKGEFHTFVYAGPIFSEPIPFSRGETVLREKRFCYCDLIPLT